MGSRITVNGAPRIRAQVQGTDEIVRVAIIRNGATALSLDHPGDSASTDWVDEAFGRSEGEVYYYLRVQQKNRQMAWANPIWACKET